MFRLAGGEHGRAIMQEYFPLMVDVGGPAPQAVLDMIFIDRNGRKVEEELATAVLNGIDIDTTSYRAD